MKSRREHRQSAFQHRLLPGLGKCPPQFFKEIENERQVMPRFMA
jgi:hypothetical protein